MRITLLTDGIYPYVIGGMQKHSYYLAKYFAKNEIEVDLYHTNQSNLDIDELAVFTEFEKKYIKSFVVKMPSGGNLPGHYIRASYNYSSEIFNLFKKQEPTDFIYAKGFSAWRLIKEKRAGYNCAPIGVNFHGFEMFQRQPDIKSFFVSKYLLQKPVLYNIRNADYVFSYGGKITGLIKDIIDNKDKIVEVPTAIQEDWLNNEELRIYNPRRIVFVGRFERRKGIEELNSVLRKLKSNISFEFHFVGPIPINKRVDGNNIFYHGIIGDEDKLKELLRSMDILICPSYSEGMPNVILEAMASGLAVIATNVGAVNLMVDSTNGILLTSCTEDIIADAIVSVLKIDEDSLSHMKAKSIERVRNQFLWANVIHSAIDRIKSKI